VLGDAVPMPVPPLSSLHAGGQPVPLDGASKVAGGRRAGGESWQPGRLGL